MVPTLRYGLFSHHVVIRLAEGLLLEVQERANAANCGALAAVGYRSLDRIHR